jgi:hypothetical protein
MFSEIEEDTTMSIVEATSRFTPRHMQTPLPCNEIPCGVPSKPHSHTFS